MTTWMWMLLLMAALFFALWRAGLLTTRAVTFSAGSTWATPHRWQGRYRTLTGRISRPVFPRRGRILRLTAQADAGTLSVEVLGPQKEVLARWSTAGRLDTRLDLPGTRRCTVLIRGNAFHGWFDLEQLHE